MRRRLPLLMLAALVVAVQANAQVDPDPDGIGIYADQAATVTAVTATPNVPLEAYLVLTRPSAVAPDVTLGGWECRIGVPENASVWGWNIPGSGWLNMGGPPEFAVAYWPGLELKTATLLMTFIIIVADSEPAQFYVGPGFMNSGGFGLPVYATWPNPSNLIPLHPYPNGPGQPSLVVNPQRTPVAEASWGEVKKLYH